LNTTCFLRKPALYSFFLAIPLTNRMHRENDTLWEVLAVHAGYFHSFAGCGIVFMPLETILSSQFKLPVTGAANMLTI
jgi:hypothetical protein